MTAKRVTLCGWSSMFVGQDVEAGGPRRRPGWRRRRRTPRAGRSSAAAAVETTSMTRRLGQVLAQPVPALRERLRLGIDPLDLPPLAPAEQAMVDPEPDLGADLQAGEPDEHLERVDDPAVGRVLQRDEAELDVPAVDLLEDRGDRADRDVLDGLAELGDGGEVAVAVLRARGRRPAGCRWSDRRAAHQLAEDQPERLGGHGPSARRRGPGR